MRLLAWLRAMFRAKPCRACGAAHGPLMTVNRDGKLVRANVPHSVIMRHYARQFDAARELGWKLRGGK